MPLIRGLLDRVVLVVGVVVAGCVPSFIAQYRQRVGGMLDQVIKDLAPFQAIADQFHHGNLQALIQHHLDSVDPTFYNEGAAIQVMAESATQLRNMSQALDTDLFHQLSYLIFKIDPVIARSAWDIFSPSLNLSLESLVFATVVGTLIWLVFLSVWFMLARLIKILAAR